MSEEVAHLMAAREQIEKGVGIPVSPVKGKPLMKIFPSTRSLLVNVPLPPSSTLG